MAPGTVRLSVSKPFYDIGEQLFGNIHVHLTEPMRNDGVEIQAYCIVSGTLYTFLLSPIHDIGGSRAAKRPSELGSASILAYILKLDPEGLHPVIQAGDHLWPVSFQIPTGVPPTFLGRTRVQFSVVHWIRVIIPQKGLFSDNGIDELFTFQVRAPITPVLYRQLPVGQTEFAQRMERSFWRDGGILGIKVNLLSSVLVPGEYFDTQLELNMAQCKVKILFAETRLLQKVNSAGEEDSRWINSPLANSQSNASSVNITPSDQVHTTVMQLPVPQDLETIPTLTTPYGGCEYFVMVFISPEEGEDIRRIFKVPLLPASSVLLARAGSATGPSTHIGPYYAPPSSKEGLNGEEAPAYSPSVAPSSTEPPAYRPVENE